MVLLWNLCFLSGGGDIAHNQSALDSIFLPPSCRSPSHRRGCNKPFAVVFTDIESSSLLWGRGRALLKRKIITHPCCRLFSPKLWRFLWDGEFERSVQPLVICKRNLIIVSIKKHVQNKKLVRVRIGIRVRVALTLTLTLTIFYVFFNVFSFFVFFSVAISTTIFGWAPFFTCFEIVLLYLRSAAFKCNINGL